MQVPYEHITAAVQYLQNREPFQPELGIILGTGLNALADEFELVASIPYEDIPNFPLATVESHSGELLFGTLAGKKVVAMRGRFHYYEGYSMQQVTLPVRVLKLLGIRALIVTNAAGGLDPDYNISDLMVLEDHINLHYENPLTGPNLDELGIRFPDMSEPYALNLIEAAEQIAQQEDIKLRKGVYVSVPGPNLETKAEYRYLRTIGADAVGMSTVPEVIVARHMNLPVFACSVITDLCSPGNIKPITVAEVIAAAKAAEPNLIRLVKKMVERV